LPPKRSSEDPWKTIFVGRLAHEATEEDVFKHFEKYGNIVFVKVVRNIVTGESKGYAFVEFEEEKSAKEAYKHANRSLILNRPILVDYERSRTMEGWVPRRLGGGLSGRKESGQLRFGGRDKGFRYPLARDGSPRREIEYYQRYDDNWRKVRHPRMQRDRDERDSSLDRRMVSDRRGSYHRDDSPPPPPRGQPRYYDRVDRNRDSDRDRGRDGGNRERERDRDRDYDRRPSQYQYQHEHSSRPDHHGYPPSPPQARSHHESDYRRESERHHHHRERRDHDYDRTDSSASYRRRSRSRGMKGYDRHGGDAPYRRRDDYPSTSHKRHESAYGSTSSRSTSPNIRPSSGGSRPYEKYDHMKERERDYHSSRRDYYDSREVSDRGRPRANSRGPHRHW